MSRLRRHWKTVLLALVALSALVCGGGAWWFTHPALSWAQHTVGLAPVVWEGDFTAQEQQAVLQAWAFSALGSGGELWVGALPPDMALPLPEGWQVLGAIRQGEPPAWSTESLWLELPPLAPEEAGRRVMRLLARAGWREPLGDRVMRRLVGLWGSQPPGFLPPGFVPPEGSPLLQTVHVCRQEGDRMSQAEVSLFRRAEGALVAVLRVYPSAGVFPSCHGLAPLGPFLPWLPLPFVVRVPTLAPPPEMTVLDSGGDSLFAQAYLSEVTLQTEQPPEAVRSLFDAQLKDQGWRLQETHAGEKAAWSVWQRRSLRGHRYEVRLFVLAPQADLRRVTLVFRNRAAPLDAEDGEGAAPTPEIQVHGDLHTPQGQAFLETWLSTQAPAAVQPHVLPPEQAPSALPLPPQARLLGGVELRFRHALAGAPGTQWLALWSAQEDPPDEEDVLQALQRIYTEAGWSALPVEPSPGWMSLERRPPVEGRSWCSPQGDRQVWVEVHPAPQGKGRLLSFQETPLQGPGCAEAAFGAVDPLYRLQSLLPDWRSARGQACGLLPQGMSASAAEMEGRVALTHWAWVKPCGDGVAALSAALQQATLAQGWQPLDEGAEGEVRWVRWQRTLTKPQGGQLVLGLYWLPLEDGWYLGDLTLTSYTP